MFLLERVNKALCFLQMQTAASAAAVPNTVDPLTQLAIAADLVQQGLLCRSVRQRFIEGHTSCSASLVPSFFAQKERMIVYELVFTDSDCLDMINI